MQDLLTNGTPIRRFLVFALAWTATLISTSYASYASDVPAEVAVKAPAPTAIHPKVASAAAPLPLSDVRLTGGPLKHAEDLDAEYLLKLEPDRMLYYLRERAGLTPKADRGYGGWDGNGRQLTGHIAGHYLVGGQLHVCRHG